MDAHRATKVGSGVYSYRGYTVSKRGGYDVSGGVGGCGWNGSADWSVSRDDGQPHIGTSVYRTLKAAKAGIDYSIKALENGATIVNAR